MKCSSCGSDMQNKTVCPVCGAVAKTGNKTKEEKTVYTGIDKNEVYVHKRSRLLLLIFAFLGGNDLYMLDFSRFFRKMVMIFVTIGIGYLIWQIIDIIRIIAGGFPTDAHGNPVEW